jgi:hypothetical protein
MKISSLIGSEYLWDIRNTHGILVRNHEAETTWDNEAQMRDNNKGSQTILLVGYLTTLSVSLTI